MKYFNLKILAISLCFSGAAQAHVGFVTPKVEQDTYQRFVLKMPHGCSGAATSAIKINIPEGIQGAKPMPKAGWALSVESSTLKKPYTAYGVLKSVDVSSLTWANGSLADAFYDEFVFQAKVASPVGVVPFAVEQTCGATVVSWSEADVEGSKHPAATLNVMAPAASGEHHHH